MIISISNAVGETVVVAGALILATLVFVRRSKKTSLFPIETTNELKGLAILTIVLSHIGYFLASDNKFLQPMSNYAGVGVDLFLVLSGYGLVVSAIKTPRSVLQFYLRRLPRIYLPMIITLAIFLIADYFILHKTYPLDTTIKNFFGIFTKANLYEHIDSPLWYITFLLINYLLFPIIFHCRFPLLSAAGMGAAVWLFLKYWPPYDMMGYYKLHLLAFPVGMALAGLLTQPPLFLSNLTKKITEKRVINFILRFAFLVAAGAFLVYSYYHSHVGEKWYREGITSVLSVLAVITIFIVKKIDFKFLAILGMYSFEIYLLHWPLVWRYNFIYGYLPAGSATLVYLALFVGIGYLYQRFTGKVATKIETLPVFNK